MPDPFKLDSQAVVSRLMWDWEPNLNPRSYSRTVSFLSHHTPNISTHWKLSLALILPKELISSLHYGLCLLPHEVGNQCTGEIMPSSCPPRMAGPDQLGQKTPSSLPAHPHSSTQDTTESYCKAMKSRSQSKYIKGPGKSVRTLRAPTDRCHAEFFTYKGNVNADMEAHPPRSEQEGWQEKQVLTMLLPEQVPYSHSQVAIRPRSPSNNLCTSHFGHFKL